MGQRRNHETPLILGLFLGACASTGVPESGRPRLLTVAWPVDNLIAVGGYQTKMTGAPTVGDDSSGTSVCFNGKSKKDALLIPVSPLTEQTGFSIQMLIKPLSGGSKTQTVLHLEDKMGDSRALFDLKAAPDGGWFAHGFVRNKIDQVKLESPSSISANEWHWLGMTFGDGTLRLFINGSQTSEMKMSLSPMGTGTMSIGANMDPKNWFTGCVKELRFANSALPVDQLARPPAATTTAPTLPAPG